MSSTLTSYVTTSTDDVLPSTMTSWTLSTEPAESANNKREDNQVVLFSAEVYSRASPIMDRVGYVLQAMGLILNTVNILVLTRPSMRNPTTIFLVALSGLQLLYIVLDIIPAVHSIFKPLSLTDVFFLTYGIYCGNYVMVSVRRCMYCLQCFVSAERLLAVMLPLKAKEFLLVRRPKLFIFATPLVVFTAHIHSTLKLEVFQTRSRHNETIHSFRYTEHYLQNTQHFDNLSIAMKIIFVYLTLLALVVTNLTMIVAIRRYAVTRRNMNVNVDAEANRKRDFQMTLTILASTLIFVVLCLPTVSNSLVYNAVPQSYSPFNHHRHLFLFVQNIGALCFLLAFSTDFFTFVSLSSAYRNTLLRMLRRKQTAGNSTAYDQKASLTEITKA